MDIIKGETTYHMGQSLSLANQKQSFSFTGICGVHCIFCKFTGRNLFHTIESLHFTACIVQYAGHCSAAGGYTIECWSAMHLIWLHLRFSSFAQTCIQNPHRFMYFQVVLNGRSGCHCWLWYFLLTWLVDDLVMDLMLHNVP